MEEIKGALKGVSDVKKKPKPPTKISKRSRRQVLARPLALRDLSGEPTIADFCAREHCSMATLVSVRSTDTYKQFFKSMTHKQVKILADEFKDSTIETRKQLRAYSDEAPKVLYEIMMDLTARHAARISAAAELLDRDGRFAKVSRTMAVQPGQDGAPMLPEDAASQMLDALNAAGIGQKPHHIKKDKEETVN